MAYCLDVLNAVFSIMVADKRHHLFIFILSYSIRPGISCFPAIFSFGDSLADTGNWLFSKAGDDQLGRPPYGETYFHRPTGRPSDGRLVVDFIAEDVGLPLLPPYLAGPTGQQGFRQGVNFAVAGATALGNEFFIEKGLKVTWTDYSLGTQIQWFKQLLPSLCSSETDCDDLISNSLFLVGEVGVNDYSYSFTQGRTLDEIQTYVPSIINAISSVITVLIELGAMTMMVHGIFPIGCASFYLTVYQSQNIEEYDPETGCIKWLNELAQYHNHLLKNELDEQRQRHTHVTIIYADYYEAVMSIVRSPDKFGLNQQPLVACCGGGGPYNYNLTTLCGDEGSRLCDDPSRYTSWDGRHFTEAAYNIIANGIMKGPYAIPPMGRVCSNKATFSLDRLIDNISCASSI